ncbi:hypothetical protein LAU_0261 [Lausannevirus]|uniref:MORN repeat-containing protein n=2 Tax=Lausannevirus TaxID=999883 RepID=A0A0N9P6V0_9VIRU|nr:hypothetical protein LAU_0261 [Lausannevirus]AEA07112.1 hypothetical protein LAU_0261 [Lausannevirus]ALH06932.1 hypothetical protein PMV_234 [Port-miou virus]
MQKFLEKKEAVPFSLASEELPNPKSFVEERNTRTESSLTFVLEFVLPNGQIHGMRTTVNCNCIKEEEFSFGKRHGKYVLLERRGQRKYEGNFCQDVPVGRFIVSSPKEIICDVFYDERGTITRHNHFVRGECPLKCQMYGHDLDYPHEFVWKFSKDDKELEMTTNLMGEGEYKTVFREIREKEKGQCWSYFMSCRRTPHLPEQRMPDFLFSEKIEEQKKPQGKPLRKICLP